MPDRWLKSGYIRKVLRPARSVKVSRGRTRTSGRCPWHPMPLLPCSPPPYCSQPHFDTKIQSTLRIYATFFFKTSPCLQPTFTRRTSGNSVVTFRTVFFCFPVITATCVCNHSPPPPKKKKLLPPHRASMYWETTKTQDWHLGMARHTKHGHEEGNRWAVGVETETKSASILSTSFWGGGGAAKQMSLQFFLYFRCRTAG